MRINENTAILGKKIVLVPYRTHHVPTYHAWMENSELREFTSSERLTLKEEYEMQESWRNDDDKLTFIILRKTFTGNECSHQTLLELDKPLNMIGDVNLFFSRRSPPIPRDEKNNDESVDEQDDEVCCAECEVMIASPQDRRAGYASEALSLLLQYASTLSHTIPSLENSSLPSPFFFSRVHSNNDPSLKLFLSLHFNIVKSIPAFGEIELGLPLSSLLSSSSSTSLNLLDYLSPDV